MKISVMSNDLLDALNVVGPSVCKRVTLPILNNVVLEAACKESRGQFVVAATNLEQSAHRHVGCTIDEYGATTLPYKPLLAYLKLVPKDMVIDIEREKGEKVTLSFGGSTFMLRGITAAHYPAIPGAFDGTPYTERDEEEKRQAAAERAERDRQEEAARQAEHDRIAALPDVFTYEYELGYRGVYEKATFDTLLGALNKWYTDYRTKGEEQPDQCAHHGRHITDKFGVAIIRNYGDVCEKRNELNAAFESVDVVSIVYEDASTTAREFTDEGEARKYATEMELGNEPVAEIMFQAKGGGAWHIGHDAIMAKRAERAIERNGPPPGIPCPECGLPGHIDDIAVTFAPSVAAEVPLQEQEEIQAAQRDDEQFDEAQAEALAKIERARRAVIGSAPAPKKPSAPPQKIKLRFAYSHQTMDKFVQRAIRVGAPIRISGIVKHNGVLTEYVPVAVQDDAYLVDLGDGKPFPLSKSAVKYLEANC